MENNLKNLDEMQKLLVSAKKCSVIIKFTDNKFVAKMQTNLYNSTMNKIKKLEKSIIKKSETLSTLEDLSTVQKLQIEAKMNLTAAKTTDNQFIAKTQLNLYNIAMNKIAELERIAV